MYLPIPDQESNLCMFLSPELTPRTSSPKGITDDVLVSTDPSTTLNDFCEFEVGEQYDTVTELEISITPKFEPHDLDDLKDIFTRVV